jgi:hypothetical protein
MRPRAGLGAVEKKTISRSASLYTYGANPTLFLTKQLTINSYRSLAANPEAN